MSTLCEVKVSVYRFTTSDLPTTKGMPKVARKGCGSGVMFSVAAMLMALMALMVLVVLVGAGDVAVVNGVAEVCDPSPFRLEVV